MNASLILRTSLLAAALGATLSAQAVVIDFEGLTGTDIGNYTEYPGALETDGYRFVSGQFGSWNLAATAGTTFSNYTGSTALFYNSGDENIVLTKIDGGAFSLQSMSLANLYRQSYQPGTQAVSFTGKFADNTTVAQSFTIAASDAPQTAVFSGFTNVVSVAWTFEVGGYHQFDNVSIAAVPEPATMAALGLGALTLLRRRKSA